MMDTVLSYFLSSSSATSRPFGQSSFERLLNLLRPSRPRLPSQSNDGDAVAEASRRHGWKNGCWEDGDMARGHASNRQTQLVDRICRNVHMVEVLFCYCDEGNKFIAHSSCNVQDSLVPAMDHSTWESLGPRADLPTVTSSYHASRDKSHPTFVPQ